MKRVLAALCAAGAVVTCDGNRPGTCSVTLSGAFTGTGACTATAGVPQAGGRVYFTIAMAPESGNDVNFNFAFEAYFDQAKFQTGTYGSTAGTGIARADTSLYTGGPPWLQTFNTSTGAGERQGSFSLTITSTGSSVTTGMGCSHVPPPQTVWAASHGTLNVTLTPLAGSTTTGTVTAQVTF
jgi:hypothetical protein